MRKLLFAAVAAGFALTALAVVPASAKSNNSGNASFPSAAQQGYGNGGGDSENATCSHFTGCAKY